MLTFSVSAYSSFFDRIFSYSFSDAHTWYLKYKAETCCWVQPQERTKLFLFQNYSQNCYASTQVQPWMKKALCFSVISLSLFEFYNQKLKPEGFAQRCSVKRAVLKISENSEEITELVSLFSKVSSLKPSTLIKGDYSTTKFLRTPIFRTSTNDYLFKTWVYWKLYNNCKTLQCKD